jgi:uncharacterized oxidoreductase
MTRDQLLAPDTLHSWIVDLWRAAGSSDREARLTADHLVLSNLSGHDSHGVGMIPRYVESFLNGELQLNQEVEIAHDSGSIVTVDGRRGMGQSVAHQAMEIAIERARQHGVCVLGLRNSHHLGRVGHWAEQATAAGLVSVHFTNAVANGTMVAPHGGREARFLTNPFTVGIPREGAEPIVLDFATSAIAHGKVRVAYNRQVPVPEGCLIDALGRPTNDPGVVFEPHEGVEGKLGALRTFAAHKGYALAMVCELLGAALIGGETATPANWPPKYAIWNNMLAIVFDPARTGAAQQFEQQAREFINWVKSSPLAEGSDEILMPGEPERIARKSRERGLPVDAGTMAQLDAAAGQIQAAHGSSPGALSPLALPQHAV